MSETTLNQEQPATETTLPAEQPAGESEATTTTTAPEQPTEQQPVEIGEAMLIEKDQDGNLTTSIPRGPEPSPEPVPALLEAEETQSEAVEPVTVAPTETTAPVKETEVETIAEVGVPKEPASQPEAMPVKVGVAGSLAIGAAALGKKFFHGGSKKR